MYLYCYRTYAVSPDSIIRIERTDNRFLLAVLFGLAILLATICKWAGPALDFFFGRLLGL